MAPSGLQTRARSTTSLTGGSLPFAAAVVFPGTRLARCWKTGPGTCGWVWMTDCTCIKDGQFRRLPEPNQQPLGLVVGITEDMDGNIWAECAGKQRKLVRIRDFQVVEEFTSPQVPPGHTLAPDPNGGIWIGTLTGDLVRLREGALQKILARGKRRYS